jgi:hypothetical protein
MKMFFCQKKGILLYDTALLCSHFFAGAIVDIKLDELVKSLKFPPPSRGRVRVGAISDCISGCSFPLPLIPSRKGRGKCTFYENIKLRFHELPLPGNHVFTIL